MDKKIESLRQFLDGAKSVFHSTELLKNRLEKEGYQYLSESENWKVKPGGKYYMTRGGAALILAGLNANGTTVVENVCHVRRGYADMDKKLRSLGADIKTINEERVKDEA